VTKIRLLNGNVVGTWRLFDANWGGIAAAARYGVMNCHCNRVIGKWLGSNVNPATGIGAAA
jgi:hypothetical protein